MKNEPLVSIIIPVFNAENRIKRCIKSVINQSYGNIEIILINDGSTDNSRNICNYFNKKNGKIKLINKENTGVSHTRNIGIQNAAGKYIQFTDADDFLNKDTIEVFVKNIEEHELLISGYKIIFGNKTIDKTINELKGSYNKKNFMNYFGILYKNLFFNSIWNKLYIKEKIIQNGILFEENINMGEDLIFNLNYLKVIKKIKIIEETCYNYSNETGNTLSSKFNKNLFINQKMLHSKVKNFLIQNNYYNNENEYYLKRAYFNNIILSLDNVIKDNRDISFKNKLTHIDNIIKDEKVINNIRSLKNDSFQNQILYWLIENKSNFLIYLYIIIRNKIKTLLYF